eukprot:926385-Amphidinium_carterae.1
MNLNATDRGKWWQGSLGSISNAGKAERIMAATWWKATAPSGGEGFRRHPQRWHAEAIIRGGRQPRKV